MTCAQRQDLMIVYAADALEDVERDDIRAHLAGGCPGCTGALAEAQATLAGLSASLDPVMPAPSVKGKLTARIAGPLATNVTSPRPIWPWWIAGVSAAAACVAVGLMLFRQEEHRRDVASLENLLTLTTQNLIEQRQTNEMLADAQMVALTSEAGRSPAKGRVFWDRKENKWHVYIFDMAPPPKGKRYELWFITDQQQKIAAGMLDTDESGNGVMMVSVPPDIGKIALAAITDEPYDGVQQPTGSIHLAGKVE